MDYVNCKLRMFQNTVKLKSDWYSKERYIKIDDPGYLMGELKNLSLNGSGGNFYNVVLSSGSKIMKFKVSMRGAEKMLEEVDRQLDIDINRKSYANNNLK